MPSPLGHLLGGYTAGTLVAGPGAGAPSPTAPARRRRDALLFAALGAAPDLDLLVGIHSRYTHSVGAAIVVAVAAWACRRSGGWRWAVACGAALASHVLLDWLGSDTTAPIGIMALWPFSDGFYQSTLHLFPAVSRRYWQWSIVTQSVRAAGWELAILGPLACAAWRWRPRRARTDAHAPIEATVDALR